MTGVAIEILADDDPGEATGEIGSVGGEGEHGHDLAGLVDLKKTLAREAVEGAAEAGDDAAQAAVVDRDGARPGDLEGIEAEGVAVAEVGVDHRGEQVVRGADGVAVAREAEVDELGWVHLRASAAGAAPLGAEDGAEAGLAEGGDAGLADPV